MGLDAAVKAAVALVRAVSGVRTAPDYPEESYSLFPFAVGIAQAGRYDGMSAGWTRGLHDIVIELHVARKDLQRDVAAAMALADSIPAALLASPTLSGTVQTFGKLTYVFGPMSWNGMDTIGWRFTLVDVKIDTTT